jgi:hypothetical protein
MLRIIGFLFFASFFSLKGQNLDFEYVDKVYVPTIKSVTFLMLKGIFHSY